MLQDYTLGVRMLLKYPGLTIAGGLALTIAIGIGAGWYDLVGKLMGPTIPLPDGDRIVVVETQNALTNQPELRVTRDFLEWRSDVRSIDGLGAYRSEHPSLPMSEVRACARIALLYMLFSFYGATTAEYDLPGEAEADLQRHWRERQIAIRRLLSDLEGLEDELNGLEASGGTS